MPKRSLSAISLTFHTANVKKESRETFSPSDLNGVSLLDLFEGWCSNPESIPLMINGSNDCLKIQSISRVRPDTVLVDAFSGKSGEPGAVYSAEQSGPTYQISENEAPTGHTRALLYVRERGETALFFSEHCHRGNAGTRLMKGFSPFFRTQVSGITMQKESIVEGSEWLDTIKAVRDIEVRTHKLPSKSSAAVQSSEGYISLSIKPNKNQRFLTSILSKFKTNKQNVGTIIGFPILDELDDAEVFATVEGKDGRTKKINVMKESGTPRFYKTLSEPSEPELSDDEFVERCEREANAILKMLGEEQ